jgi:hypothetical protein
MSIQKFVISWGLIVVVSILFTYPLMWLLNYVFTSEVLLALFGIAKMTFWKTFALGILTGLLFRRSQ